VRKKIGELDVATDAGVRAHVQQTAQSANLHRLRGFLHGFAAGALPLRFDKYHDGKPAASSLLASWRHVLRRPLFHERTSVKYIASTYTTSLIAFHSGKDGILQKAAINWHAATLSAAGA
jgi:hypothetical protein